MPASAPSGTVLAVSPAPGTTGTVSPPATPTCQTAGSTGDVKPWSVVAIETTRVLPDSTGATTAGSATVTVAGDPSAGTGTRNGATAPPSRMRVPSGETSVIRANRTASAGAGCPGARATLTSTRGEPATTSADSSGGVVNAADWPGRSDAAADSRPATAPRSEPIPGSEVIAAGVLPAGCTTGCGAPSRGSSVVSSGAVPGRPG